MSTAREGQLKKMRGGRRLRCGQRKADTLAFSNAGTPLSAEQWILICVESVGQLNQLEGDSTTESARTNSNPNQPEQELIIESVSRTDRGMYQCVVDASLGLAGDSPPPATSKMTSGHGAERGATTGRRLRRRTARGEAALELGGNTRDWQPRRRSYLLVILANMALRLSSSDNA